MGIPGLWDILGDGEVRSLASLSSEHFMRTGKPLRIAVDEAGWRFHNLTPFQVAKIREQEPAANPIEKAIFFRLIKLLKLNIRLLFVFDGPGRPWKRNRKGGGRLDYSQINLLRKLLDVLKIPHHIAPAEAEAECARLQQEDVVDAVWSEDGDTLMFGCRMLFREYRVDNKKSDTHVRLYRATDILAKHGLDSEALVAFALLSGGDYDTKGLPGCGSKLALKVAQAGLGRSLCRVPDERSLYIWRQELAEFLTSQNSRVSIPPDFPRWLPVKHYARPKTSAYEELHDLRGLRRGWDIAIDETKLREFVRVRFDIWTRGYIKHIVPVLFARLLSQSAPHERDLNTRFGVRVIQPRRRKAMKANAEQREGDAELLERKITYLPLEVVSIDLSTQPVGELGEDWSIFEKDGTAYDPVQKVETEMLECLLRRGLPDEVFEVGAEKATKSAQKGKKKDGQEAQTKPTCKRKQKDAGPEEAQTNPMRKRKQNDASPAHLRKKTQDAAAPLVIDLTSDNEDDEVEAESSILAEISREPASPTSAVHRQPLTPRPSNSIPTLADTTKAYDASKVLVPSSSPLALWPSSQDFPGAVFSAGGIRVLDLTAF